jgi:hypothetical protein
MRENRAMDALTAGADIGTMATGLAAVTAAVAWTRNQWDGWQVQRRERKRRNWHGYIDVGGINTVPVRLAESPKTAGAIVTLEVLDKFGGKPDEQLAAGLRIFVQNSGFVSRPPTEAELEFLIHLRKREGYNERNLVIR